MGGFLGGDQQRLVYLAVAPLLPVALVGGAYDTTDSLRELAEPTTFSKVRIALLRSVAAISFAVPLALLMGLVRHIALPATVWLVASLALTVSALSLFTWFAPQSVVLALSAAWLAVVAGVGADGSAGVASEAWFQLAFLAVLLAAALAPTAGRIDVAGESGSGRCHWCCSGAASRTRPPPRWRTPHPPRNGPARGHDSATGCPAA